MFFTDGSNSYQSPVLLAQPWFPYFSVIFILILFSYHLYHSLFCSAQGSLCFPCFSLLPFSSIFLCFTLPPLPFLHFLCLTPPRPLPHPPFPFLPQGRATGSRAALWVRTKLQVQLLQLGLFSHKHAGKVLFVALLALATFCVGLKSATLLTDVEKLWVEGKMEVDACMLRVR